MSVRRMDIESELEDCLRQAVRIIARLENEGDVVSREGQDFLARARRLLIFDPPPREDRLEEAP